MLLSDILSPTAVGCTTLALFVAFIIYYLFQRANANNKLEAKKRNLQYYGMHNTFVYLFINKKVYEEELEYIKKFGTYFGFNLLNNFTVMLSEPDLIQQVLSKDFTTFTDRRSFPSDVRILRKFLTLVKGEDWKRLRSIVTPTFSSGKLRRMKPCLDDTINTLLKNFDSLLQTSNEVSIKKLAGAYTMDTIIQVAFGVKVDSMIDDKNPVIINAKQAFSTDINIKSILIFLIGFTMPKLSKLVTLIVGNPLFDFFENMTVKIIDDKRKEFKNRENLGKASSFIELLLEAEAEYLDMNNNTNSGDKAVKFMTNEEILAQCILFFIVGYDTTATTISLALYMLALNPSKQNKLHQEIVDQLERLEKETGESDPLKLVTLDELNNFKYLSAVVDETLRLYPPGTVLERTANDNITLEDTEGNHKVKIFKGDVVRIPVYAIHHSEKFYPNPEQFQPERFLDEPTFHKYTYLPFGSGPRNCVAKRLALMEAKLAILNIIRNYKLETCSKTMIPMQFFKQPNFLSPKDVLLKATKR